MKAEIDRVEERWSGNGWWVMLAQSMILAMFLLAAILYPQFNTHPERLIYPVCVFLLVLFVWTLYSWRALTGNLFDPYTLFMTAAFIFNAGLAFLEVFHLNIGGIFVGRFSQQTILETLMLVTIGLTAFHSGALLTALTRERKARPGGAKQKHEQDDRSLRLVGWVLLGIATIPAILLYTHYFAVVTSSGYLGFFQQQTVTGFGTWSIILSEFMVPGALFLLAGSKKNRLGMLVSSSVIFLHIVFLLLLGGRAGAIMPLLAFLWLWDRSIRKVPRTVIVVIAILLISVLLPAFGSSRNLEGQARYSISGVVGAYKSVKNPTVTQVSEMGGSMQTVAYTIDLVPKTKSYVMGESYYNSLLLVLPNIFWSVHPAYTVDRPPSSWLVRTVDPKYAARGGGFGYSFIAEAYLNFGWWGAAMVLGLMGLLFSSLVLWADRSDDFARLAMVASFLSFFLFFPRSEMAGVIRPLVWYAFLPYLAVIYFSHARSKQERSVLKVCC